jgi:hypothetical protein
MKKLITITTLILIALTTGCSINHPVAKDYDQHLAKYGEEKTLPRSRMQADYLVGKNTANHSYQFRAATVGYAHVWIVEFGKILDKTINADYVQSAFGRLDKGTGANGNLVEFELESFEFKHYRAYTALNIKVRNSGREIFNKTYQSEGDSQGGQMWTAGPFGMKNATLKSTKRSIDKILEQFINDINKMAIE